MSGHSLYVTPAVGFFRYFLLLPLHLSSVRNYVLEEALSLQTNEPASQPTNQLTLAYSLLVLPLLYGETIARLFTSNQITSLSDTCELPYTVHMIPQLKYCSYKGSALLYLAFKQNKWRKWTANTYEAKMPHSHNLITLPRGYHTASGLPHCHGATTLPPVDFVQTSHSCCTLVHNHRHYLLKKSSFLSESKTQIIISCDFFHLANYLTSTTAHLLHCIICSQNIKRTNKREWYSSISVNKFLSSAPSDLDS